MDARAIAERLASRPGFVWLDGDGSAQGTRSYLAIEPSEWRTARFGEDDPLVAEDQRDLVDGGDLDVVDLGGDLARECGDDGGSLAQCVSTRVG